MSYEEFLGRVPIFASCTAEEIAAIAGVAQEGFFQPGQIIVTQGTPGQAFYMITRGRVEILRDGHSLGAFGPGDFFGEMSLLTGEVRSASIRVKEDAEFIVIDKESFRSTLVNNPSIAESLSKILSERQAGLEAQRERLDAASLELRKQDNSGKLLHRISEFFGLKK